MLLCSVPPQGLVASQFHLMFQKPHLFADLNSIMTGDCADVTTCCAKHLLARLMKAC
ncbi:MAG: hypothetical protein IPJ38_21370 [Dechloromonas sp.]|uniref:Uncharacterized protein n=1 Tax=Candidatus Dechloromonas phosphorivorans TaxID=2899244 RepID=A0A935K2W0_9RHOO|nr:hypothetical protein [Candidatus Dechloromonas phosphorivorans]